MAPESTSPLPTTLPTIDQSDSDPEPEHKQILQHDCVTGQHGHVTKATPKQRVSVSSDEEDGIHLDNIAHGDSDIGSHDLQELGGVLSLIHCCHTHTHIHMRTHTQSHPVQSPQ